MSESILENMTEVKEKIFNHIDVFVTLQEQALIQSAIDGIPRGVFIEYKNHTIIYSIQPLPNLN